MATQYTTTAKRVVSLPCPVCGKKSRGEMSAAAAQTTGFFTSEAEARAESQAQARSELAAIEQRFAQGDQSLLTSRKGLVLRCASCGYESTAATFAVYFWLLMVGVLTSFLGIGVLLLAGGTVWYALRTHKMRARLGSGRLRNI